jgi:heme A synthase
MDVSMKAVTHDKESGGRSRSASEVALSNPWLFRYAVALACCVLIAITLGALVTGEIQPIPGSPPVSPPSAIEITLEQVHLAVAVFAGALVLGLAVWLQLAAKRAWPGRLGWAAAAVVLVDCVSGTGSTLRSHPHAAGFFHASLAHILLSLVVAITVGVAQRPDGYQPLEDSGKPSLRSLAISVPSLAFLQVLLGAAYRHDVMGVMFHILNALVVGIVVLTVSMLVIRQFPQHSVLQPAALALAIVTGVQVCLGFATFITLLIVSGGSAALLILSTAHVATGALTLAASVALAIQIRSNLHVTATRAAGAQAGEQA